jgi:CRP-like cAMP-binding protein
MLNSFFNYPDQAETKEQEDLLFLHQWDDAKWNKFIQYTELRRFKVHDQVIRYGDIDNSFYIIVEGQLEVLTPLKNTSKMRRVRIAQPGTVVGEQAFLDGKPRSATLHALTDGSMLAISQTAFNTFAMHEPDMARELLMDLARTISVKLRLANAFIANLVK